MRRIRPILFWAHLTAGVLASLFILTMCVTGVLLAFERQIVSWADSHNREAVQLSPKRSSLDDLLSGLGDERAKASGLTIYSDPSEPVAIAMGREKTVFIDPDTGRKLGESSTQARAFFSSVERFHRALGEPLQKRGAGRTLIGAANFLFCGIILSGLFLWMPRRWRWANVRAVLLYRRRVTGKARDWNWHHVTGIWCAIPLFVIALSGVIMSYQWANNLLYKMTGNPVPQAQGPPRGGEGRPDRGRRSGKPGRENAQTTNFDQLFSRAEEQVQGWKSITLRLTPNMGETAAFTIDSGNGGQPNKRAQLTLDSNSGQTIRWEPFESLNSGRRLRSWARFAHTGEAGGILGQVIATVATLGGIVLVWTGLALALRRAKGFSRNARNPQASAVDLASVADPAVQR